MGINIEGIPHPVSANLKVNIKESFKKETVHIGKMKRVAIQQGKFITSKDDPKLPAPVYI
jgi:hypothetical protein